MTHDDLNALSFDFNGDNSKFLDTILSTNYTSENSEIFNINLEASIDDTIDKLEKILHLEALSDDELADLYATDCELHDDIDALDFDGAY
jgi:hypothetical protein